MRRFIPGLVALALLAMLFTSLSGCFKKELLSPNRYSDTTIIAGSDSAGFANGTGNAARFDHPFGMALDQAGNLYIADQGNSIIREMTPGLVVSTFAGTPHVPGSANGTDTLASFNKPFSVAVDGSNNVYVADAGNNTIRKIAPDGTVSTFAGTGVPGSADGTDTATFNSPLGVTIDQSGNLYVADYGNDLIRKITPAGVVSTIAGKPGVSGAADGLDTAARFDLPESVAVDVSGNIYVADNGNNEIRKITPSGQVSTLAGNGTAGNINAKGSGATFNSPFGLAIDASGNIYVADSGNNLIRKVTSDGTVSTFAGSGAKGAGNANGIQATFNTPAGITIDASGNLYVSDENNNIIRKITASGAVSTLAVSRSSKAGKNVFKLKRP